ncbi:phenylalanine aminomutase (D-beta-phenylalanine forming) [Candidatus Rhabdochlamydia porcellionis]|jgi:histidine ammonia-lyase|uniref:Tyrosine ammonia-lyase n=1 Tax=Candidatus Rhabdochlamydia porcellionis TaxID=225148 RepID=A0ABX8Z3B3_9BACT|nr:phenylalanine aminomutase (D-beta-phenylalanine forming) [Candidatus Rhabdochlamydia porcellionis]QZA59027.1 Tyrosine ammonia-lyase [Candidatus Rhabdochlamydia porcellionis]
MILVKENDTIIINGHDLTTEILNQAGRNAKSKVEVSAETKKKIEGSRELLDRFVEDNRVIYGVNTSLGGFVDWLIPIISAGQLQENLISAVATNVGSYLDDRIVRATILTRLNSLARGASAISWVNFDKLMQIYNAGILPCIPSKGSLGASGDLGPLACIALVATGKWKAKYQGQIISGEQALKEAGIQPMKLSFKEGLCLINGTSAMASLASLLVEKAISLIKTYDVISCLTFEGLMVKKKPFHPFVHAQKPHQGQLITAKNIWAILQDSQMAVDEKSVEEQLQSYVHTQPIATQAPIEDAYSIRCTPQIIGPIRENLEWVQKVVTNELNSSNDNPLILCEHQEVFHNGHFHGQYISMAMDHLSICMTTLSNLSDRRIDRFMDKNHSNQLPAFLCLENPGLRLGLMGGQFMSASLTAENRSLCSPVSIQSLTSTGDFQDIVSLGLVAGRRAQEIYENSCYVLAFELLCGVQAAEIRGANLLSSATREVFSTVRKYVPYLSTDQCLTDYLEKLADIIKTGVLLQEVEKIQGRIPFMKE